MSNIYVLVDKNKDIFRDFIRVRCLSQDCENKKSKLISVAVEIKYLNGLKRIIAFFCEQHLKENSFNNDKYEIALAKNEIQKALNPAPSQGIYEILLHNAQMKLDGKSCCFRENKKYENLDTLLNSLSLTSNDDSIIKNQIKRIMIQKYFQLFEVQKKIKEQLKQKEEQLNPLQVISLIENKNQIVKVLAKIEYLSIIRTHDILSLQTNIN